MSIKKQYSASEGLGEHIQEVIRNLKNLEFEYNAFVSEVEAFFNNQIDSKDELEEGVIELSDKNEELFFPFENKEGKLSFVDNKIWRLFILTAILKTQSQNKMNL
jgi:hypothetical protein